MPTDLRCRELPAWVDPAELYLSGAGRSPRSFWLDAGPDAQTGWSWVGTGEPASSAPREARCVAEEPAGNGGAFRGGWIGWLDYDDAASAAGAPAHIQNATSDPAPGEHGLHVDRFVALDHASRRAWAWAPGDEIDRFVAEVSTWRGTTFAPTGAPVTRTARSRHTPDEYAALIARCREAIAAGDAYQLCLTTRFEIDDAADPLSTYLRLRTLTPTHHGALIRIGTEALASASPERFLEIRDGRVTTRPIKGTRPRSTDRLRDAELAAELRGSVKEQAENVMIVDLMRNDLQRVSVPGSVTVDALLDVESYAAVHQLVSTVSGTLSPATRLGDVLTAAFPAGSMTGAPKLSAMTILHELEGGPRGAFAGCFGWMDADGRADLAMTIRSISFDGERATVGAGGGITWRSDPAEEVAEVGIKARGSLAALGADLPPGW